MSFWVSDSSEKKYLMTVTGDGTSLFNCVREDHLWALAQMDPSMEVSLRDPELDVFTKWTPYTAMRQDLLFAHDIHRRILINEIVIESDQPTYEENLLLVQQIGPLIERAGWKPVYYYSGSKSIHIHCYFDYHCLVDIDAYVQKQIMSRYNKRTFMDAFIQYLRKRLITGNGLFGKKDFDHDLIKAKHLIRAEGSKNKKSHKTFLSRTFADLPQIPPIRSYITGFVPEIASIELSRPENIQAITEEFLEEAEVTAKKLAAARKEYSLMSHFSGVSPAQTEIDFMLSDEFAGAKDGYRRALFIISTHLSKGLEREQLYAALQDWNLRMGAPLRDQDITWAASRENPYKYSRHSIDEFLLQLGYKYWGGKYTR